jgi:hypothetical protein
LSFLKNTSNCTEQPKKEKYVTRREEVMKEEAQTGNPSTDSANSGSGPYYQIYILLGWTPL